MRRSLFFAAVGAAVALLAAREFATAAGGHVGNISMGGGGGHAVMRGGGSFSHSFAPAAPMRPSGGGYTGGRLPSMSTYAPPVVRSYPVQPSAPVTYPRSSVPSFAAPARPIQPNIIRPPVTFNPPANTTRPLNPAGAQPAPSGRGTGEGFIGIPRGPSTGLGAARVPTIPGRPDIGRGVGVTTGRTSTTQPRMARGFGAAAGVAVGLGAMPAIQQHLQKRGQDLQTWSAGREQSFNQAHQQNASSLQEFQQNRESRWSQLQGRSDDRVRMARDRGGDWQNYRRDLWRFRSDRAKEIRDRTRDGFDDLFTSDWWQRHHGRNFVLGNTSPWWWWNSCPWDTLASFGDYGWTSPIYYDYDANVAVADDVYVDGQDWGPSADYAQQAIGLANPPVVAEEPVPAEATGQAEWQPFGVFALTQEEKGDAVMFFQLAINKDGLIGGAFTNTLTDDTAPVSGSVDRKTQRAAWHVGDKTNTVYEAGVANLTLDVAPVLVHFDTRASQTWLLVRLPSPDLPTAPASINVPKQP